MKRALYLLVPLSAFGLGYGLRAVTAQPAGSGPLSSPAVGPATLATPSPVVAGSQAQPVEKGSPNPLYRPVPLDLAPRSLAEVLALPSTTHAEIGARIYYDSLTLDEMPRAVRELVAAGPEQDQRIGQMLFRSWAMRAPAAAARAALTMPSDFDGPGMSAAAVRVWARLAPAPARAWAEANLPNLWQKETVGYIDRIVKAQAENAIDPLERIKQALPNGDVATWPQLYQAFKQVTLRDPLEATRLFLALPEDRQFGALTQLIFDELRRRQPEESVKFFKKLSHKNQESAAFIINGNLLYRVIPEFRDFALEQPASYLRTKLLVETAKSLIFYKVEEASAFVESLPAAERFGGFFDYWEIFASGNPEAAAATLVRARQSVGADVAAKINVVAAFTRGVTRFPESGARAALLFTPAECTALLRKLAPQWISQDPEAAFRWMQALPEGEVRLAALAVFTAEVAAHDASRAASWIERLPAGLSRDHATRAMAWATFDTDPSRGLLLARSLSTPRRQQEALREAIVHWLKINPDAAAAWLETASLSDEEREALREVTRN